ncbi:hypothetical protein AM305_00110 [Actinobacillus minor NM305]|uniref:Uncharacterized protein n=1 Tax=Actinobacillus minor NM305 TaxID=637911 RepID=C5RYJ4_9PAST|nr:hypothetical protein AM305_00110 [Actinobacillus minor NM305]
MKYFYIILTQFVVLLTFNNSIKNGFYFDSAFWLFLTLLLSAYILYKKLPNKETIKKIKFIYSIITSSIFAISFTLIYNYLLGLLYINYFEITGIKNTLFISNGFLSNTLILLSSIALIYLSFALYIILSILIIYFSQVKTSKDKQKRKFDKYIFISLFLVFIPTTISFNYVMKYYHYPQNTINVIKYYLYEYQYFDNKISEGKYICKNFNDIIESIYKTERLQKKDNYSLKVYPLFSENKASFVLKYNNQYYFRISECI